MTDSREKDEKKVHSSSSDSSQECSYNDSDTSLCCYEVSSCGCYVDPCCYSASYCCC